MVINQSIYYFYSEELIFMTKNMLKRILLMCLVVALPAGVFAQIPLLNRPPDNTQPIMRHELLEKTWYFVAMKCPDKIGAETHQIRYFMTLQLTVTNANNINYGTYVKVTRDQSDNPRETGTYSLTSDEVGNVVLTLKKKKSNTTATYVVPLVEANHLTLIRTDGEDKCNISYAIAP
jgi:hypothetical protein